jgi:hypothetical protein
MVPEGSLLCSQEPSTDPYPQPDQYSPYHPILILNHVFLSNYIDTLYQCNTIKTQHAGLGVKFYTNIQVVLDFDLSQDARHPDQMFFFSISPGQSLATIAFFQINQHSSIILQFGTLYF